MRTAPAAKCNKWSEQATVHENPMNEIWFVDAADDDASPALSMHTVLCLCLRPILRYNKISPSSHIHYVPKGYLLLIIM